MPIVDSHCHVSRTWYEPVEVLLFQMERNGVDHAVLIQMNGQYDNSYQAECAGRYPNQLVSVVFVDPTRPDAADQLAREQERGATGVRLGLRKVYLDVAEGNERARRCYDRVGFTRIGQHRGPEGLNYVDMVLTRERYAQPGPRRG